MELFKSLRLFILGVMKRIYWLLPTLILDPFDLIERLLNVNYDIPQWAIWTLFTIGLMIAIILTYHELRMQKTALEKPINWIDAHKRQHGKFPPVPDYLLPVVQNYSAGKPVSKEIQLITPSMQFWANLMPSEREKLLGLVEWLGIDPQDYEEKIKRHAPPGGHHIGLIWKR